MADASEFTGGVPRFYDRYLAPVLFEPYAADLVGRLPSREALRVLELACGTGVVTRRLREALPSSATLVATDLNEPMIAHAQAAVSAPGIVWLRADAQALPFADASFDLVVCQFGFMFVPDKPLAFRETRRVLAPAGLLLANVWHSMNENPNALAIQTVLNRLYPADPPRFLETPYGCHDTARLRADMAEAGWQDVQLEAVRMQSRSPSAEQFATGFVRGSPLTHSLVERGANLDTITRELTHELTRLGGSQPFKPTLAATIITARR